MAFYWGLSVPRLYLHISGRGLALPVGTIPRSRDQIFSQESSSLFLYTIPRIRPRFLVWPHTPPLIPLSHPDFLAFSLFLPSPWQQQGSCVPSTCTNRRKVLAQHCVHVLSILCQSPGAPWTKCPRESSSLGGSGLSVPWRVTAKFPWPCVRGPGPSLWVWAALGSRGFWTGRAFMWMPAGLLGPGGARREGELQREKHFVFGSAIGGKEGQRGKAFVQAERTRDQWEMRASSTESGLGRDTWGRGRSPRRGFSSLPLQSPSR